jgi:membrane protease YdiL (CAAX protease family)
MTEQHPDSSSRRHPGQQPSPPTYGPTPDPTHAFPAPAPYGGQPYDGQPYVQQYGPLGPPAWRDPMPDPGTEYHRFLRTPRNAWWKGVVAIVGFVIGYLVITTALAVAAVAVDVAAGRSTWEAIGSGAVEFTPAIFLATNVGNALSIPLAMFLQWLLWGQPIRWIHSVAGAIRWDLVGRSAAVVVPLWILYMIVSAVALPQMIGTDAPAGAFTTESLVMLIIMLLTTPLQAAGEEYGARGLIMRAAGSWVASPVPGLIIATLVPSFVFMLAHGAGDPWLNVYYFGFGAAMSILAWRTGGLEATSVVHIVNNMMGFGIVILAGQEINLDRSAGTGGAFMLLPMAMLVVVTVTLSLLSRRWNVRRTYQPAAVVPGIVGTDTH